MKFYHNTVYRTHKPEGVDYWWSNRGIRLIQTIQSADVANNIVHNGVISCEDLDGA